MANARVFFQRRWVRNGLVGVILLVMGTLQVVTMVQETQTFDEGAHLAAGVSYLQARDFRMNEEHPPFVKMLAGMSVLLTNPHMSYDTPAWRDINLWEFSQDFMYRSGNDADRMLFFARIPMVLISLGLGLLIYYVGKRIGGEFAGFFALGWYAFDPNFLAHGRYVTTDVAATLGYLAVLVLLLRVLERWTQGRLAAFGLVFALAQMTKYSTVFLWVLIVIIPITWILIHSRERPLLRLVMRRVGAIVGWAAIATAVVMIIFYFGQVSYGRDDQHIRRLLAERDRLVASDTLNDQISVFQKAARLSDATTPTERFIMRIVLDTPIPAWSYFKGLFKVVTHNAAGHTSYLLGQYSKTGWWWYFPAALFVKTPAVTFVLMVFAAFFLTARWWKQHIRYSNGWLPMLTVAAVLYFAWSMTSNVNLGVRHIFPVYPIAFIAIGYLLSILWRNGFRWSKITVVICVILYLVTSFSAFPAYMAYFSEFVGGSKNGPQYLTDSSIDWGQDLKRLQTYLIDHNVSHVCLSYFGQADLTYYRAEYQNPPTVNDPHEPTDVNCVVAMSVTNLFSQDGLYAWLRDYEPDERIGGSIYVYDFREGRVPAQAR